MTTKHAKSIAVAPEFAELLGAAVMECPLDTDALGTFSGEIERQGSALDCARRKCELGMDLNHAEFGIASEGSFGPHPLIPFISCGQEILYFIDRKREFHLHLTRMCEQTNYRMQAVDSFNALQKFAADAQFPSHALVVRPNQWKSGEVIFKGVNTPENLKRSFQLSQRLSPDGLVWVETDMRAHLNPTRMSEIRELSRQLAQRLAALCPDCQSPGWGLIDAERGLRCESCDYPTEMIAHEIFGCVLCEHVERRQRRDGLESAPQMYCGRCNP